jgi:hypothetical protein
MNSFFCLCSKKVNEEEKEEKSLSPFNYTSIHLSSTFCFFINQFCSLRSNHLWKMIYRSTLDGFTAQHFYNKVSHYSNQLLIIRTKQAFLFGAFTKIGLSLNRSNKFKDQDAFLFTLVNPYNIEPSRLDSPTDNFVINNLRQGPGFGLKKELWIGNKQGELNCGISQISLKDKSDNYLLTGQRKFVIDQIEVYTI